MSPQNRFIKAMDSWTNIYFYRSLSDYFDYLKTTNISMQQAYALTFIHYNGPSKISTLCEHMVVSPAAASQMVNRLEKQNLVQRIIDPADRRVRNVALSEKGEHFVKESIKARQNWAKNIPDNLSEDQLDQISMALQLLTSVY